ncbi:alpha/beta hydrolase family protein [Plebeiibacterium sediminum]|uniref:Prolyl oligopeptidase family serine peptidase n=1 Tax=Plebeiibacterium sediminum TaxID=2992112 RepID=A0AAE3M5D7_9BACT|nr:prolyl oligopeptidase family serine peptidase [Plebeiobacterium sediminum]MCW3787571.1 prolyl oligopeptidase family serine peptidase [Plebeiobacterium sediminum]
MHKYSLKLKFISLLLLLVSLVLQLNAQMDTKDSLKVIQFDDTRSIKWSSEFKVVDIKSSADDQIQKAYVYGTSGSKAKPLIVSLHTWSGDYTQKDPLARKVLEKNWNYIHPNFRGPNRTYEATGSEVVLSDIEDAIQYALKNMNVDRDEVHIVGVSGGGFATLAAFMNVKYPVKSFSAWAPISDLEAWYWESVGRNQKYANDIINSVSRHNVFDQDEAIKRSPLFQPFPQKLRKGSQLYIYEGIHDGYTGSVPITHSINMYNRLVGELKYQTINMDSIMKHAISDSSLVTEKEIIDLVTKRINPDGDNNGMLFDRKVHLKRKFQNISLFIFEGGHEQIPQALELIHVNE